MRRSCSLWAIVWLAFPALCRGAEAPLVGGPWGDLKPIAWSDNLLANPGFEEGPSGWKGVPWQAWTQADEAVAHAGRRSVRFQDTRSAPWYPIVSQAVKTAPGLHKLQGWAKTQGVTTQNGGARIGIDRVATSAVLGGTADWTALQAMGIVPGDSVNVSLQSYLKADGSFWYDDLELRREMPPPVEHFLRYPNFRGMLFEGQPQVVRLWVKANPSPSLAGQKCEVLVTLRAEGGEPVARNARPMPQATEEWVAELPVPGQASARSFLIETRVVDAAGKALFEQTPYRIVRVSAEERGKMRVWVDDRQAVHLGGKPAFILGIYNTSQYWEDPKAWEENHVAKLSEAPLNLIINYWQGGTPPKALHAYMDALLKHGIYYLQTANNWYEANQWYPKNLPWASQGQDTLAREYARALIHPGLAGFYTADERTLPELPPYYHQYRLLRESVPDSLTLITQNRPEELARWRDVADVLSTDPYPLYGAEPKGGYPLGMVADWTRACQEAVQRSRPVFAVLQYFQFTSKGRWPTCDELRNMSYMAIVEGAKGLLYWSFGNKGLSWVKDLKEREDYWGRLKRVTGELHELEPVLLSPDSPGLLSEQPAAPLRVLCKEQGGRRYVFASNPTDKEIKATFHLKAETKGISVHKEGRNLTPENGDRAFGEGLGPFQAHAYVVQSAR